MRIIKFLKVFPFESRKKVILFAKYLLGDVKKPEYHDNLY